MAEGEYASDGIGGGSSGSGDLYSIAAVSKSPGISESSVRNGMGKGGVFGFSGFRSCSSAVVFKGLEISSIRNIVEYGSGGVFDVSGSSDSVASPSPGTVGEGAAAVMSLVGIAALMWF